MKKNKKIPVKITKNTEFLIDDVVEIQEIDDSEIEWVEELVDVYEAGGKEFYFDDIVNDFTVFCDYMFARMGFKEPTSVQKRIIDFIIIKGEKDKMIQGLRGIGKSLLSQLYVLWRLLRNNDEHILVRSASSKRSRNYTTFLLNTIKTTPILQHLAPTNKHRKSSELFDVNGSGVSDSPSVLSASISSTVTGLRASLCVLDDVEVTGNASSIIMRETLEDQINENYNLLTEENGESGEVLCLGTFQSTESIYIPMINNGSFDCFVVPAEYVPVDEWYEDKIAPFMIEAVKNNPEIIGTAVDTRFNMTVLNKRKLRVGKTNYALHYMLDPRLTDELKFPLKLKDLIVMNIDPIDNPIRITYSTEAKINRLKHRGFSSDYFVQPAWTSEERATFDFTILAVDPSGRGLDNTGYAVISLMGGKLFYRTFGGLVGGYDDDSLHTLVGLAQHYKVNAVVCESNFGDGAYTAMLTTKLLEADYKCSIEEVRATVQKELRIVNTLEPLMNQHRIIVDRDALEADFNKNTYYSLTYQLTHMMKKKDCLKGKHDDIIDVFELGASFLVEYMANGDKTAMERYADDRAEEISKMMEDDYFATTTPRKSTYSANEW